MPPAPWIRLIFAVVGAGLLASVLASIEFGQVIELIGRIGWGFLRQASAASRQRR